MREYLQIYSGVGKSFKDEDFGVSFADFPRGYTFLFLI